MLLWEKSLTLNPDFLYQERDVIDICHAIASMNGNKSFANPLGTLSCKCLCSQMLGDQYDFFKAILKWIVGLVLVLEKMRMPSLSETRLEGISLWLRWIPQSGITRWYWLLIYLIILVPEIVIEISMLDIFLFPILVYSMGKTTLIKHKLSIQFGTHISHYKWAHRQYIYKLSHTLVSWEFS